MMGEVQRAMRSSVSRRKTETTLSNVYKQQLIKKCLDEYCVPLEMKKALSSHTNQVKGPPLLLVNLLQHGMLTTREITRRWFQHIPDVQSRTHELHLFLPPQLLSLCRLASTQISEVRWDNPCCSFLLHPAVTCWAATHILNVLVQPLNSFQSSSQLSLPEMLVIEIMSYFYSRVLN